MRHPQHLTAAEQCRADRLENLARSLGLLRRAVARRGRGDVETFCDGLAARLAAAPLADDDRAEIAAVVDLVRQRVRYGLHERLRKLLLPLVAAMENQLELST
jgi:hypothetical protein